MHWLIIAVGLWMTSPAQTQETIGEPIDATANSALALDDLAGPTADDCAMCASEMPDDEPQIATVAPPPVDMMPASEVPEARAASAPRRVIPRSAETAAMHDLAGETSMIQRSAAHDVPWYRSPYAALGGVLVLIVALTVLARRFLPSARPIAPDVLRVVGRAPMGAKQSAVLVHVGRRLVLVGITADAMRTLAEITDPEEVSLLLGKAGASRAGEAFNQLLAGELAQYEPPDHEVAMGEADVDPNTEAVRATLTSTRSQLESLRSRIRAMQNA